MSKGKKLPKKKEGDMVTLEDVKNNPEVQELVIGAQKQLNALRIY